MLDAMISPFGCALETHGAETRAGTPGSRCDSHDLVERLI